MSAAERGGVFEKAFLFEQERTVGPKVREEVSKFDCPVLTKLVLRPLVRFAYFPRTTGWPAVAEAIRYQGVLPECCFDDPLDYADELRAELTGPN